MNSTGTKEKIIQIISASQRLTTKQIHCRLQREFALQSTYQATHKNLKKMVEERTLIKDQNGYSINPEWVENYKKNAEQLAEKSGLDPSRHTSR